MESARHMSNLMRIRDLVASGHAMPFDLPCPIGDIGSGELYLAVHATFVDTGISVPISRGSPPIFRDR